MKTYTNNSELFKHAHALTRKVIKDGDDYQTTFGMCLKYVKSHPVKAQYTPIIKPFVKALYNNMISAFEVLTVMLIGLVIIVSGDALELPFEVLTVAFVCLAIIISLMIYCVSEDVVQDFEDNLYRSV